MIEKIFLFFGIVSLIISIIIPLKLRKKGFYDQREIVCFNKIGIVLTIYALIKPKAFFKPKKIFEGWIRLFIAFCLFIIAMVFISKGLGYS